MKFIFGLILSLNLLSCSKNVVGQEEVQAITSQEKQGFDMNGNEKSCAPAADNIVCTEIYMPEDAYGDECVKQGHEKVMCGCHNYLCTQKIDFAQAAH